MHYLQSFLTVLIASEISASRIMGILYSAGFKIDDKKLVRRNGWDISASALRRELKQRARECAELFEIHKVILMELSAVGEAMNVDSPSSEYGLIRHEDGSIECKILGVRAHHSLADSEDLPPYYAGPWRTEQEAIFEERRLRVKRRRLRHALKLENMLDSVVKDRRPHSYYADEEDATRRFIREIR